MSKMSDAPDVEYIQSHNIQTGDRVDFVDAGGHYICQAEVLGVRGDIAQVKMTTLNLVMEVRNVDLLKLIPYEGSIEQQEDLAKREVREQELTSRSFAKMMAQGV